MRALFFILLCIFPIGMHCMFSSPMIIKRHANNDNNNQIKHHYIEQLKELFFKCENLLDESNRLICTMTDSFAKQPNKNGLKKKIEIEEELEILQFRFAKNALHKPIEKCEEKFLFSLHTQLTTFLEEVICNRNSFSLHNSYYEYIVNN